ncbi:sigma 54-interacting transcriptional regulator [bacterium]|nr:sigma 54-interacting transcriptional regulator [bacterium]
MIDYKKKQIVLDVLEHLREFIRSDNLAFEIHKVIKDVMSADNVTVIFGDDQVDQYWITSQPAEERGVSYTVVNKAKADDNDTGYWFAEVAERSKTKSQMDYDMKYCLAAVVDTASVVDRRLGTIYCDVRRGPHRYTEQDARFLKYLADHLAVYLELVIARRNSAKLRDRNDKFMELQKQNPATVLERLVGFSPKIVEIKNDIMTVISCVEEPVLIQGETGTGKGVVAKIIHDLSSRSSKEFVTVECSNLQKELAYSELWGHKKGAYSDAREGRTGLVRTAHGGTLFLDEIGDLPLIQQGMLLRVLQEGKVRPLGEDREEVVNFRLICATNRNLHKMVQEGKFREDLYWRINKFPIYLPPLRDRKEDISVLADHFAKTKSISPDAICLLKALPLTGNVRELQDLIGMAKAYAKSMEITLKDVELVLERCSANCVAYPDNTSSTEPVDGKVLLSRVFLHQLSFQELQEMWNKKRITKEQLRALFDVLFTVTRGAVAPIGRRLGITEQKVMDQFIDWVGYLRKQRILPLKDEFDFPARISPESLDQAFV